MEEDDVDFCDKVDKICEEQYGADLCFNLLESGVIPENATPEHAARIVAQHMLQARRSLAMTDKQYQVLLDLFHEYHEAFLTLSEEVKMAFFARLFAK